MLTDEQRVRSLTRREISVIYLKCQGKSLHEIAYALNRNSKTVQHYITKAYKKLNLQDFPDEQKQTYLERLYCGIISRHIKAPEDVRNWIPVNPETGMALVLVEVEKQEDREEVERGLAVYQEGRIVHIPAEEVSESASVPVVEPYPQPPRPNGGAQSQSNVKPPNGPILPIHWKVLVPIAIIGCCLVVMAIAIWQLWPSNEPPTPTSVSPTSVFVPGAEPVETREVNNLTPSDELSDDRVTLSMPQVKFLHTINTGMSNWTFVLSVVFHLENHADETILLHLDKDQFRLTDNTGREYDCAFWVGGWNPDDEINRELLDNAVAEWRLVCGRDEIFGSDVVYTILQIDDFTSLPPSTWRIDVPR